MPSLDSSKVIFIDHPYRRNSAASPSPPTAEAGRDATATAISRPLKLQPRPLSQNDKPGVASPRKGAFHSLKRQVSKCLRRKPLPFPATSSLDSPVSFKSDILSPHFSCINSTVLSSPNLPSEDANIHRTDADISPSRCGMSSSREDDYWKDQFFSIVARSLTASDSTSSISRIPHPYGYADYTVDISVPSPTNLRRFIPRRRAISPTSPFRTPLSSFVPSLDTPSPGRTHSPITPHFNSLRSSHRSSPNQSHASHSPLTRPGRTSGGHSPVTNISPLADGRCSPSCSSPKSTRPGVPDDFLLLSPIQPRRVELSTLPSRRPQTPQGEDVVLDIGLGLNMTSSSSAISLPLDEASRLSTEALEAMLSELHAIDAEMREAKARSMARVLMTTPPLAKEDSSHSRLREGSPARVLTTNYRKSLETERPKKEENARVMRRLRGAEDSTKRPKHSLTHTRTDKVQSMLATPLQACYVIVTPPEEEDEEEWVWKDTEG